MTPYRPATRHRILFTSVPAYGHALPMLPLVRAAIRAGHDVRFATGPDLVGPLRSRGIPTYAAGPTLAGMHQTRQDLAPDIDRMAPEEQIAASAAGLFGHPARERRHDLQEMLGRWRPDVVVHDPLELAGPMVARALGLPSVLHGYGPMFHEYDAFAGVAVSAAGEPDLWQHIRDQECLDICPPALRPPGPALWPDAFDLRPSSGEPGRQGLPEPVARLLAASMDPVVYLTLGTVSNSVDDLRTSVEAVRDLPVRLVVTTGPGVDPQTLGGQPPNVAVTGFVPQALILERADLLVSQAGAGTMLGALVHGVPQVCVPRGADQPWNAAAVERAGAGLVVPPDAFSSEAVRAAVERVLARSSYAAAADRVAREIGTMLPAPVLLPELLETMADREVA